MNCPTCDCEVFAGPSPCCCPTGLRECLRIRWSNVLVLVLSISLCQFLISTPLTSMAERLASVPVSVGVYAAGWRYWLASLREAVERTVE